MFAEQQITYTNKINVAAYASGTHALGPGFRAVVWTQGCPFHCQGCIAPSWIPFTKAKLFSPEELLVKLNIEEIDGLTFSGGEPMVQAENLAKLARLARQVKDLNLICFTGYRYERLLKNPTYPGVSALLDEVDVLIDGAYMQTKNDSRGLRGSSNQRILHLTNCLRKYDLENQNRNIEVTIKDGEFSFIGIPTPEIKKALDMAVTASVERTNNERL